MHLVEDSDTVRTGHQSIIEFTQFNLVHLHLCFWPVQTPVYLNCMYLLWCKEQETRQTSVAIQVVVVSYVYVCGLHLVWCICWITFVGTAHEKQLCSLSCSYKPTTPHPPESYKRKSHSLTVTGSVCDVSQFGTCHMTSRADYRNWIHGGFPVVIYCTHLWGLRSTLVSGKRV